MAEKQYLRCSAKEKTFRNGNAIINLGVKVEDLIAFAKAHANDRGYLNLVVSPRRSPGQYGDTHSVYLDDYVPSRRSAEEPPF